MLHVVRLNLDGTYGSLRRVDVRGVVHHRTVALLQVGKHGGQRFERHTRKAFAQLRVLRHGRQLIASEHSLKIQAGASAEYRLLATAAYVGVCGMKILLILEEVILCSGLRNVYEMIRHTMSVHHIVGKILARSYIHAAINLARVGTKNFSVGAHCECRSHRCLAACRRSEYGYHLAHIVFIHQIAGFVTCI